MSRDRQADPVGSHESGGERRPRWLRQTASPAFVLIIHAVCLPPQVHVTPSGRVQEQFSHLSIVTTLFKTIISNKSHYGYCYFGRHEGLKVCSLEQKYQLGSVKTTQSTVHFKMSAEKKAFSTGCQPSYT